MVEGLVRYTPPIQRALDKVVPMDAKPVRVREEQNLMKSGPKSSS